MKAASVVGDLNFLGNVRTCSARSGDLGKITLREIENSQVESESTLFIKIYANVTTYPLPHARMRTYDWVLLGHMFLFEMPLKIQHSTPSSIPPKNLCFTVLFWEETLQLEWNLITFLP